MTDEARVAVVIPCYGDGRLAVEAVRSIREDEPVEVVVVDDHSTDDETRAALATLEADGVTVVRHDRNRGLADARNSGLAASSARFVLPLDADDRVVEGALARMADALTANPDAGVCFGDYIETGKHEIVRAVPEELDAYRLAYTNEYPVSSMFRRSVLEDVGGWPLMFGYEDWHLWMTLVERGTGTVHLGKGLVTYRRRLHGDRLLRASKAIHKQLYARLREDHPQLFRNLRAHRRRSTLGTVRKVLYPVVYGGRRRYRWEAHVKTLLDRLGIWTLRR
jgi:glycosyltransferase involved in cell wall biosynthesis